MFYPKNTAQNKKKPQRSNSDGAFDFPAGLYHNVIVSVLPDFEMP
jgi:hypothetical protein